MRARAASIFFSSLRSRSRVRSSSACSSSSVARSAGSGANESSRRCSVVAPAFSRSWRCSSRRRSRKNRSCAAFMYSDFGILVISASVRCFALLAIVPRCDRFEAAPGEKHEGSAPKAANFSPRKEVFQTSKTRASGDPGCEQRNQIQSIVSIGVFATLTGFRGRAELPSWSRRRRGCSRRPSREARRERFDFDSAPALEPGRSFVLFVVLARHRLRALVILVALRARDAASGHEILLGLGARGRRGLVRRFDGGARGSEPGGCERAEKKLLHFWNPGDWRSEERRILPEGLCRRNVDHSA